MEYKVNEQYKDRLFCFIFGNEKYKKYALSLYNALNGVNYQNANELEIVTLKDVIYIRMHNDVAVMLSGDLEVWEHQSTVNPNMPLRGMMYFARLYERYLVVNRLNRYASTQIMIPTPKYTVFYNGEETYPAKEEIYLSDAFLNEDKSGKYEWTATVINLNHGDNRKRLKGCEILWEYMDFVLRVRKLGKKKEKVSAVDEAVREQIQCGGELAEILLEHRAEVVDMLLTEFNEEEFISAMQEVGMKKGREEGLIEGARRLIRKGKLDLVDIADSLDLPLETIERLAKDEI